MVPMNFRCCGDSGDCIDCHAGLKAATAALAPIISVVFLALFIAVQWPSRAS